MGERLVFSIALFADCELWSTFLERYYEHAIEWLTLAEAHRFHLVVYVDRRVREHADGCARWQAAATSEWVTVRLLRGVRVALGSAFYKHHKGSANRYERSMVRAYTKMGLRWQVLDDYPSAFVCVRDADSPISPFDLALQRRLRADQSVKHFAYTWKCTCGLYCEFATKGGRVTGGGTSIRKPGRLSMLRRYHTYLRRAQPNRKSTRSTDESFFSRIMGNPDHTLATNYSPRGNVFTLQVTGEVVIPGQKEPGDATVPPRRSKRQQALKAGRIPLHMFV